MPVNDSFGEAQFRELVTSIALSNIFISIEHNHNLVAGRQSRRQVGAQFVDKHRPQVDFPALFMKIFQVLLVGRVCIGTVLGGTIYCVNADGYALLASKLCPAPTA